MGFEKLDPIPGISDQVVHHSFIDIFGMMKAIPVWFKAFNYDFFEKGLAEKDIGTGHQLESEWIASRNGTDYLKFKINLTILIFDLRKVVADDGSETYWGRTRITIKSNVEKDPYNYYKTKIPNRLLKYFVALYERYFLNEYFKKHTGKAEDEAQNLLDTIRVYLK